MVYLLRTTPSNYTAVDVDSFDKKQRGLFTNIHRQVSHTGYNRANLRFGAGKLGLFKAECLRPSAFISSYFSSWTLIHTAVYHALIQFNMTSSHLFRLDQMTNALKFEKGLPDSFFFGNLVTRAEETGTIPKLQSECTEAIQAAGAINLQPCAAHSLHEAQHQLTGDVQA